MHAHAKVYSRGFDLLLPYSGVVVDAPEVSASLANKDKTKQ